MKVTSFEDLIAWQKAQDLAIFIYQDFKDLQDFSFKDQICRASVSISNNIAEGFERRTNKDFTRFLYIARGSCSEVKSMLYLARKLDYLENSKTEKFIQLCEEILKILRGLIKSLPKD